MKLEELLSQIDTKLSALEQKVLEKEKKELESLSTEVKNLYKELGIEPTEDIEKMDVQSLSALKNSLLLLKEKVDLGGSNGDEPVARVNDHSAQVSSNSGNLIDVLADMYATALGLPTITEEEKEQVRIMHYAMGIKY